ncbi:hypothetical protein CHS0354_025611 [Potamilus streckersoni]|uniref:Ig-like domain-containing protein n=1 Tax=Potamilus streckersoni TaxID=2493646 RepID=A0AAE0S1F8_9BIVA|nr:hypothetical protein CHS0354_025611 [Potamilus streckersoni]
MVTTVSITLVAGPTSITFNPKDIILKEHNALHVSCPTDCFPLCSFQWFKLDPSSGLKNVVSEEHALQITEVTRDMSGNYSCKVQNIITGKFDESSFSLNILCEYGSFSIDGPDEIVLNASNKIIQVDEYDSITIVCAAQCFPPCLIIWTERYRESIMRQGADLKLVNVKTDGTYTCHAKNPKIANSTILRTIVIKVKYGTDILIH